MKLNKYLLFVLLAALIITPVVGFAQDIPEDNPFEDDPFFTKPVNEWFSAGTDQVVERAKSRSHGVVQRRGVDEGHRDVSGLGVHSGHSALNKMHPYLRFNRVEKIYIGAHFDDKLSWGVMQDLKPFGSIGYSFGRKEWLYTIGLERFMGYERRLKIGFSHHHITDSEDQWRTGWIENSLAAFITANDNMDYFSRRGIQAYSVLRHGNYLEYSLAIMNDSYKSLQETTQWSLFGRKSNSRINPFIQEGEIQMVTTGLSFNRRNVSLSNRFVISADAFAEFADIGLDSDFEFNRYQGEIRSAFRIDQTALLRNRIRGGIITGDAPDFKQFSLGGISTMRARSFKSITGTSMLLMNAELDLGKSVGRSDEELEWNNFLNETRFMLFLDLGWMNELNSLTGSYTTLNDFSFNDVIADVGAGVSFNTLRFELAWPTTDLSGTPVFWVRLNQTF